MARKEVVAKRWTKYFRDHDPNVMSVQVRPIRHQETLFIVFLKDQPRPILVDERFNQRSPELRCSLPPIEGLSLWPLA